jgi:hypothetical protein
VERSGRMSGGLHQDVEGTEGREEQEEEREEALVRR